MITLCAATITLFSTHLFSGSSSRITLSYRQARTFLFGSKNFYLQQENSIYFINDQYCKRDFTNQDFNYSTKNGSIGPKQIPDHKYINAEHIWPKYRFCKTKGSSCKKYNNKYSKQLSDLHNLLPVDSKANSIRGHLNFGKVVTFGKKRLSCPTENVKQRYKKNTPSKIGYINTESLKYYFEPPDNLKGNIARAMFYFSNEYNLPIDDKEESFLRKWNKLDPVTKKDRAIHEAIFKAQNNRNIFIDDPNLVDQIDNF